MFSKSLTIKQSIGFSFASTLFSMGYILHDRMEASILSLLSPSLPQWNVPTSSQKEEWDR